MLWRVFIPSWRFFDRVGPRPRVFVREDAEWRQVLIAAPRRWFSIVFNPEGNLHHADQNLVERLLEEIADGEVADLVSYQVLVRRLPPATREFKIVAHGEDVLRASL